MAGVKVVTRKLTPFHGEDEEFSNVYYFGDGGSIGQADATAAESLVNAVIAAEKTIFADNVRFLGGQAYGMGIGGSASGDAIATVELAATGNQGGGGAASTMYAECAIDIKWLLGGRRYLRSLLHTRTAHGIPLTGDGAATVAGMSTALKTFAANMVDGPWPGAFERIAPNGDRPTAYLINPYMEHRQFHRYRRRNAGLLG